jgi:hypothetical protein
MFKQLIFSIVLAALSAPTLAAQGGGMIESGSMRFTALSGGLTHGSALVVDPAGRSDTRLTPGPTFGLELQLPDFPLGSFFAGISASFSSLEHGANLGAIAGPGSSDAAMLLGTAGVVFEATGWFDNVRPTLRLGGGFKSYMFSTNGASSNTTLTGDFGAGFRAGSGPIEIAGEVRFLPSAFDQAKLPLRGLVAQDQQQNDLMFTVGVTVRP